MREIKNYKIVFVLLVVACMHDIILEHIFKSFGINPLENEKDYGVDRDIILGLIIAPILETYIFQYLPHKGLRYFVRIKSSRNFTLLYVFLSTVLFCLSHFYSWQYILAMILPGILLSWFFQFFFLKYGYNGAIYFITLIHFLKNLVTLIDKYLIHNFL